MSIVSLVYYSRRTILRGIRSKAHLPIKVHRLSSSKLNFKVLPRLSTPHVSQSGLSIDFQVHLRTTLTQFDSKIKYSNLCHQKSSKMTRASKSKSKRMTTSLTSAMSRCLYRKTLLFWGVSKRRSRFQTSLK